MLPGVNELIITVVVIALLFGATRVPRVVKYSGKTFYEYKKGQKEGEEGLKQIEHRIKEIEKKNAKENSPDITQSLNLYLNKVVDKAAANKQKALLVAGLILIAAGAVLVVEGQVLGEITVLASLLLIAGGAVLAAVGKKWG